MSSWYLKFRLQNARIEVGRYERRIGDMRVEMNRLVELCLIEQNEVAHLESLIKEMYGNEKVD